jgi:hypothetical protein
MEFEDAERRLAQEQSTLRGRTAAGSKQGAVSAKAKREVEYRKKQQERLRLERERQAQALDYQRQYMAKCDRTLRIKPLSTTSSTTSLRLKPTSIHGEGDKIALPPSVLEFLMQGADLGDGMKRGSPWTFRIGIPNPEYQFPASPGLIILKPMDDDRQMTTSSMDVDSDNDDDDNEYEEKVYLEELSYKYCSLTHGTVVEFTQEEGYVGLPASIAHSLLDPSRRRNDDATKIPIKRTVDPSSTYEHDHTMTIEEEKTPGHLAWGAFDLPDVLVEITMVDLPKGKRCVLMPTEAAIQNGFYALKDVKLVLEQSLVRTRATLSVGDVVHTWHRGVKFDLVVASVTPSTFHAISCINTDLEVDFEAPNKSTEAESMASVPLPVAERGHVLSSQQPAETPINSLSETGQDVIELQPEPPVDQKEGICTIQIQADGTTGRRRFDANVATLQDLFLFASTIAKCDVKHINLVTRFPRRVLELNESNAQSNLAAMSIQPGRELFIVERK